VRRYDKQVRPECIDFLEEAARGSAVEHFRLDFDAQVLRDISGDLPQVG
jgi:hypothetical protein